MCHLDEGIGTSDSEVSKASSSEYISSGELLSSKDSSTITHWLLLYTGISCSLRYENMSHHNRPLYHIDESEILSNDEDNYDLEDDYDGERDSDDEIFTDNSE